MYKVKLENFEGPLDLLLFFVRKDELDIYDIPIAHITRSYLEYLHLMHELNLDIAAEFILMAATLMRIKVKSMLPKNPLEEEEDEALDPREELTRRLIEYRQFKEASKSLAELDEYWRSVYRRSYFNFDLMPQNTDEPVGLKDITFFDLLAAYKKALAKKPKIIYHNIERINVTIEEQQEFIFQFFGARHCYLFTDLCAAMSKIEIVVTFLAMLDLIKHGTIAVKQATIFDDIWVYKPEAYVEDEMEAAEHAEEQRIEAEEQAAAIRALEPGLSVASTSLAISTAADATEAPQAPAEIQTEEMSSTDDSKMNTVEAPDPVVDLAVNSGTGDHRTRDIPEWMDHPSESPLSMEPPVADQVVEPGHTTLEPEGDSRAFEDDVLEPTTGDVDETEDESTLQDITAGEDSRSGSETLQTPSAVETIVVDGGETETVDEIFLQVEPPVAESTGHLDTAPVPAAFSNEKWPEADIEMVSEMDKESAVDVESTTLSMTTDEWVEPGMEVPKTEAAGEQMASPSGFRTFFRRIMGFVKRLFTSK